MKKGKLFRMITWCLAMGALLVGCSNSSSSSDSSDASATTSTSGAYYQSGGTVTKTGQNYATSTDDESGVKVENSGSFTLSDSTITTDGDTSSQENSSFYGLNAGVLATSASTINLTNCAVNTTGTGANGVFATGAGTTINLSKVTINCTAEGGHGVDATMAGTLNLKDVNITTAGAHGAAISTDRGGGTINVDGGTTIASGTDSPGIYCTGTIVASNATISGAGAEAAVIEGANSISLTEVTLSAAKGTRDRGVMIYQSMSGDAEGTQGTLSITGGSFTWPSVTGPAFYVTNSTGVINLTGVTINNSGTLVKASADQWGASGANGGTVMLTGDQQILIGDMVGDAVSSLNVTLKNSSQLTGAINAANSAKSAILTLDAASSWYVTADSYLTSINDADSSHGNIHCQGHSVFQGDTNLCAN